MSSSVDRAAAVTADGERLPPASRRLEDKVALITGGASGIGGSIARLFWRHGAKVCVVDIQDDLGQQLCESLGGETFACFLHCDVTNEKDMSHAVDFTVEKYGKLDIMVNNAGISGDPVPDIRNFDFAQFKKVFDINVNGVFLGMKHAARVMIPQAKGSIISLGSVASVIGGLGPHAYTSSKHALLGLTRSVAAELGNHGIRVNCVSPYAVATGLSLPHVPEGVRVDDALKGFYDFVGSHANLKGVNLMANDVAEAVLYLASDEARYISGVNLTVDGGFTCVNHSLQVFR
uniref:Xanthoxin dehydrogenase n=1 Tax=Anthurium amnicola TaxID=1678845 RepID=A0A1D1YE08_9ARAE